MPCSEELEAVLTKECCNLGLGFFALWPEQACEGCMGTCVHTRVGVGDISTVREPPQQQKAGGAA